MNNPNPLRRLPALHLAVILALPLAGAASPPSAHAQTPDQAPAAAFAGGRMVRGTVTATAPDHLTLKTEAGETFQVTVTPNTQVRKGRDPMKFAEVHPGDGVGAMGEIDRPNKTVHALMLMVITAEQIKKAKEDLGKTYIIGKVTAMDDLKLTILRSDGVTQVIQVDDGTSFKRGGRGLQMTLGGMPGGGGGMPGAGGMPGGMEEGQRPGRNGATPTPGANVGESITLADIKVGDLIGGTGALKSGVFIPTDLNVADPVARGQRRRQPDGAAAPPPGNPPPPQP